MPREPTESLEMVGWGVWLGLGSGESCWVGLAGCGSGVGFGEDCGGLGDSSGGGCSGVRVGFGEGLGDGDGGWRWGVVMGWFGEGWW